MSILIQEKGVKSQVIALDMSYLFCNSSLWWSKILSEKPKFQQHQNQVLSLSHSKPIEQNSSKEILVYPSDLLENESIEDCFERLRNNLTSKTHVTNSNQNEDSIIQDSDYNENSDTESDILISCDSTNYPEGNPVLTMYKRVDKKSSPSQELFPKLLQ